MAIRPNYVRTDTTNRVISSPLDVSYVREEVSYDVPARGDPDDEPEYVEQATADYNNQLSYIEGLQDTYDEVHETLEEAETDETDAYDTWYGDQTLENYLAWHDASVAATNIRNRLNEIDYSLITAKSNLAKLKYKLDDALEKWAVERESIYSQGGKLVGFVYRRIAKMSATYFGFSKAAALACKAAYDALYAREFTTSAAFEDGEVSELKTTFCPSTVTVTKGDGDNYNVTIEVSEEDVHASPDNVVPSTLFTAENARVYLVDELQEVA